MNIPNIIKNTIKTHLVDTFIHHMTNQWINAIEECQAREITIYKCIFSDCYHYEVFKEHRNEYQQYIINPNHVYQYMRLKILFDLGIISDGREEEDYNFLIDRMFRFPYKSKSDTPNTTTSTKIYQNKHIGLDPSMILNIIHQDMTQ
jgi:hypothetical protein